MGTSIPDVRITHTEARGFLITCSACPLFRTLRRMRIDADLVATGHLRTHAHPHADEEDA